MSNNVDLDANVDEVKKQIRESDNPDLEALLEEEKSGKDRKTIKEFLQKRIDEQEVEIEDTEDDLVEQIEEDTRGGLLGGFSRRALLASGLAAGLVLGLLLGAAAGFATGGADADITAEQAEDRVAEVIELQFDDYSIESVDTRNGMFYIESSITQVIGEGNETQEQDFPQNFYLTLDGELLFPEQQDQLGQVVSPINIDQELQRADETQQETSQEELPEELEEELEDIEIE